MKYALFEHKHGTGKIINTGDHIQSLAAKQFLPQVDFYVERDRLNKPEYKEAKIIMNGWFTFGAEHWPPNKNLIPLFISFHLNPAHAPKLLAKQENIDYLKKYGPVGCRDFSTLNIMESYGIPAYYSSCLTTTLDIDYKSDIKTDKIYFVDVLYGLDKSFVYKADPRRFVYHLLTGKLSKNWNLKKKKEIINKLIPKHIQKKGIYSGAYVSSKNSNEELYRMSEEKLKNYSQAKLVITSRIHSALPCLAIGTPVLFILDGLEDFTMDVSRFNGILDHINILSDRPKEDINKIFGKEMNIIHPKDVDWENPPANPTSFISYANALKEKCKEFIG